MTGTLSTQETSQTPWEPVATGGQWTVLDGATLLRPRSGNHQQHLQKPALHRTSLSARSGTVIRNAARSSDELLMNSLKTAFVWGNAGIAQLVQSG